MSDFNKFLGEIGLTQIDVDEAMAVMPVIPRQSRDEPYYVGPSEIHGIGVFATKPIAAGERVAVLWSDGNWTHAGRYANHALDANCEVSMDGNDMGAVAVRGIDAFQEITVDYRHVREGVLSHG